MFANDFRVLMTIKFATINFCEIIITNFYLIDTNEFDDCLNNTWKISFAKKFRRITTMISKDFRKIKTKNQLIDDAKILFRDEIRTIFDFENFNKINVFLFNKQSKIIMIRQMTFSYSLIKFIAFSNFEKFNQISYSKSQFFQRIKYFDSRFLIWRLLIKRSISKNFIIIC